MLPALHRRHLVGSLVFCFSCLGAVIFYCFTKLSENEFEQRHVIVVVVLLSLSFVTGVYAYVTYKCYHTSETPTAAIKDIENNAVQLPCQHHFHALCISTWLKSSNTCPVCRSVPQRLTYSTGNDHPFVKSELDNQCLAEGTKPREMDSNYKSPECSICLVGYETDKKIEGVQNTEERI